MDQHLTRGYYTRALSNLEKMKKILEIALNEYGTKEIPGELHSSEVLNYFKETGFAWVKDDETAWCAAFANWVLFKAGYPGTGSLMARSFLNVGEAVHAPQQGDIVVLWRVSRTSPYGHVGFYVAEDDTYIYALGGNQSDEVNISKYKKDRVLSYQRLTNKSRK